MNSNCADWLNDYCDEFREALMTMLRDVREEIIRNKMEDEE